MEPAPFVGGVGVGVLRDGVGVGVVVGLKGVEDIVEEEITVGEVAAKVGVFVTLVGLTEVGVLVADVGVGVADVGVGVNGMIHAELFL